MTQHAFQGEITGNPFQGPGKHREYRMKNGRAMIPLGDRQRAVFEYGDNVLEERDSVDIATSKRR